MELVGTVAKQLVPSCVTVQRCGGCCPDDGLECVPTGQHQVRMQILMIRYPSSQLGEMSLEEHSQCECRPKKRESAVKPDSPRPLCPRCPQRRQRPDPRTCHCRCRRRSFLRCQGRGLELNPDTCRCRKLRRLPSNKVDRVGRGDLEAARGVTCQPAREWGPDSAFNHLVQVSI
nr:vascular endothelial growth factor B isoform X4 [Odocoileus virginianus texanus]XP_020743384.1 vascular endothelial growth factor B isoform X4 [Odocoileus virginianus texanus]